MGGQPSKQCDEHGWVAFLHGRQILHVQLRLYDDCICAPEVGELHRALAAYARAFVRHEAPRKGTSLIELTRRILTSAVDGEAVAGELAGFDFECGCGRVFWILNSVISIVSALIKAKTKRLKQRARRAAQLGKRAIQLRSGPWS